MIFTPDAIAGRYGGYALIVDPPRQHCVPFRKGLTLHRLEWLLTTQSRRPEAHRAIRVHPYGTPLHFSDMRGERDTAAHDSRASCRTASRQP